MKLSAFGPSLAPTCGDSPDLVGREAVEVARAHGRSWNQIAVALGVSRQAARQRFASKVGA
jgi:hypothetical protein